MARGAPVVNLSAPSKVDHICGLRKVGPNSYVVVTGRVVDGQAVEWKVDPISQPLDHAALTLTMKLRAMVGEMP